MRTTQCWKLGVALLVLAGTGCARNARSVDAAGDVEPAKGSVTLTVVNHNLADVDVSYSNAGSTGRRLGVVAGGSTATFAIGPGNFPTGQLRLVATLINGGGAARAGPLIVGVGRSITFTVEQDLSLSAAVAH